MKTGGVRSRDIIKGREGPERVREGGKCGKNMGWEVKKEDDR